MVESLALSQMIIKLSCTTLTTAVGCGVHQFHHLSHDGADCSWFVLEGWSVCEDDLRAERVIERLLGRDEIALLHTRRGNFVSDGVKIYNLSGFL